VKVREREDAVDRGFLPAPVDLEVAQDERFLTVVLYVDDRIGNEKAGLVLKVGVILALIDNEICVFLH
jgi:hypothetical protein